MSQQEYSDIINLFKKLPIIDAEVKHKQHDLQKLTSDIGERAKSRQVIVDEIQKQAPVGRNVPRKVFRMGDGQIGIVEWHGGSIAEYITVEVVEMETP